MYSRREFLEKSLILSAYISSKGFFNVNIINNITFEEAKNNASLRQDYINQVISLEKFLEVKEIIYDEENEKLIKFLKDKDVHNDLIENLVIYKKPFTTPLIIWNMGKKEKWPIFVGGKAFTNLTNSDEEFLSSIEDHEILHVKDMFYGMNLAGYEISYKNIGLFYDSLRISVLGYIRELDAYGNQIIKIRNKERKVSKRFFNYLMKQYELYLSKLRETNPISKIEYKIMQEHLHFD